MTEFSPFEPPRLTPDDRANAEQQAAIIQFDGAVVADPEAAVKMFDGVAAIGHENLSNPRVVPLLREEATTVLSALKEVVASEADRRLLFDPPTEDAIDGHPQMLELAAQHKKAKGEDQDNISRTVRITQLSLYAKRVAAWREAMGGVSITSADETVVA